MAERTVLPRLLFWSSLTVAGALAGLVLVAPWLAAGPLAEAGWSRVLGLFAHDTAVRRISLFAAVGVVVTACVLFRPPAQRTED